MFRFSVYYFHVKFVSQCVTVHHSVAVHADIQPKFTWKTQYQKRALHRVECLGVGTSTSCKKWKKLLTAQQNSLALYMQNLKEKLSQM